METAKKLNKKRLREDFSFMLGFYGDDILFYEDVVIQRLFMQTFGYNVPLMVINILFADINALLT